MSKTKNKILVTALHLFNKQGLYKVTLRGIADEIGISQGNLNYHFKKREHIIEALYHELVHHIDMRMFSATTEKICIATLHLLSNAIMDLFYKYRFFLLDFNQIMREQNTIRQHYNELTQVRKKQTLELFNVLVSKNLIRPEAFENEFENLYLRIQIIADFWMSSTSIEAKEITPETTQKYVKIITESIYPYLTPKGIEEYNLLMV